MPLREDNQYRNTDKNKCGTSPSLKYLKVVKSGRKSDCNSLPIWLQFQLKWRWGWFWFQYEIYKKMQHQSFHFVPQDERRIWSQESSMSFFLLSTNLKLFFQNSSGVIDTEKGLAVTRREGLGRVSGGERVRRIKGSNNSQS